MTPRKNPYRLVIHLPLEHPDDQTAQDHAKLALAMLKPLMPEGDREVSRATLYNMADPENPTQVPWDR